MSSYNIIIIIIMYLPNRDSDEISSGLNDCSVMASELFSGERRAARVIKYIFYCSARLVSVVHMASNRISI